jgi:micrococcal nuclease
MRRPLAIALVMSVTACDAGGMEPPPMETAPTVQAGGLPIIDVIATVSSVADGDSFRAMAGGEEIEVRLVGINAPEGDECFGSESKEWLNQLIDGKDIGLALEAEPDQFDRLLARAVIGTTYVNLDAVATGHALVVSEAAVDRAAWVEVEDAARLAGAGLWGEDICGASGPKASLEIVDIVYNKPGPVDVETVTIENTGDEPINLSDFTLRDESSTNRYAMPTEVLSPGARHVVVVTNCEPLHPLGPAWCVEEPVWNNGGDAAFLLDIYGRIVAVRRY